MERLNLPVFGIPRRIDNTGKEQVFDFLRKRWVVLSPEEWVRQNLLRYLVETLAYPPGRMAVEVSLSIFGLKKRADAILYSASGKPALLIECKAPAVDLTDAVFAQASRYNIRIRAPYLLISNGIKHYCAQVNLENGTWNLMDFFPVATDLEIV